MSGPGAGDASPATTSLIGVVRDGVVPGEAATGTPTPAARGSDTHAPEAGAPASETAVPSPDTDAPSPDAPSPDAPSSDAAARAACATARASSDAPACACRLACATQSCVYSAATSVVGPCARTVPRSSHSTCRHNAFTAAMS